MKQMQSPLNGWRNIQEFAHAGEVLDEPDPNRCTDLEWAEYIFIEDNKAGLVKEWWCHVATAYWFIAERDTVRDEIVRTFDPGELFKERRDYTRPEAPEKKG